MEILMGNISYWVAVATLLGVGGLYGLFKLLYPPINTYVGKHMYYHSTGIHVIKNIEKHFGREAGQIIRDIMSKKGYDIMVTQMRLDVIENAVGIGIYICDENGKCSYANKTLATMFGMQQEDMLGYGWSKPIINQQKAVNNWQFSVSNGTPYSDAYEVKIGNEIKEYYTEAESSVYEGRVIGYVGIVKEVKK